MMGKAMAHENSQLSIHFSTMPGVKPKALMVARPEIRNVMMNVSASGSATRM